MSHPENAQSPQASQRPQSPQAAEDPQGPHAAENPPRAAILGAAEAMDAYATYLHLEFPSDSRASSAVAPFVERLREAVDRLRTQNRVQSAETLADIRQARARMEESLSTAPAGTGSELARWAEAVDAALALFRDK